MLCNAIVTHIFILHIVSAHKPYMVLTVLVMLELEGKRNANGWYVSFNIPDVDHVEPVL